MSGRKQISKIINNDFVQNLYLSLSRNERLWSEGREYALVTITEFLSESLNVKRASIWQYSGEDSLLCVDLYDATDKKHSSGAVLDRKQYPAYFSALDNGRVIDAHDAHTDPRTSEFYTSYLKPLGIGAMLDASLRIEGRTNGVVCLEHVSGPRLWTRNELAAIQTIADLITQILIYLELKETVSRYESILSNMPSAAYRCANDKHWTMYYVSAGIETITGYTPTDFIQNTTLSWGSIIDPRDYELVRETVTHGIKVDQSFNLEYRIRDKHGKTRWIREYGRAIFSKSGNVAYLDGVLNDITHIKEAEFRKRDRNDMVIKVSQGLSCDTGEAFFRNLCKQLAIVLEVDFALIAKCTSESKVEMETLAVFGAGEFKPNFTYELEGTPCSIALGRGICCYPVAVQNHFPSDELLRNMQIEGYIGASLHASSGEVLGIIVVLNKREIRNVELVKGMLSIFADRAGAEMERQQAEQALVNSRIYYQSLFDSAGDAILLVQDGVFVDCNSMALTMFGCSRSELIGRSPLDLSPKFQPDGQLSERIVIERVQDALKGKTQHFSWLHSRNDGRLFDAEVTLNRVELQGGAQVLGLVRDVSDRKRVERIVQKQAEQWRASVESLPGIFYMFDQHGKVVNTNQAYLDLFNLRQEEISGLDGLKFIHDEDQEIAKQAMRDVLTDGKTIQIELRAVSDKGNGPVVHLLATGSRAFLDDKPYLVGAAFDISERVAAEQRLENSQNTLQERNQNLSILNALSSALYGTLDEKMIYKQAVESFASLPYSPAVVLMLCEEDSKELSISHYSNLRGADGATCSYYHVPSCIAQTSIVDRCVKTHSDVAEECLMSKTLQGEETLLAQMQSEVSLPLFDQDQPLGVVVLLYKLSRSFSEPELQSHASMANILALSLSNARYTQRLKFQAQHDPLTGLYNRIALNKKMDDLLAKARHTGQNFALMLIDLDRFKEINDTLGHDIGDQLICTVGPRILFALQNRDIFLSRLGGDEFALLVPDATSTDFVNSVACVVVEAIRDPLVIEGFSLEIGASIGIALSVQDTLSREELLRQADVAMYSAKHTGRDYSFYSSKIDNHSREKLALMSQLRAAIDEEQLLMHYQPKLDLGTQKIVSFEALIRWQHPRQGLIFPDRFIPIVEMSDLIHPMTELAIRQAIIQIQHWNSTYSARFSVAVNISTRNLLDNDFPVTLAKLIDRYRFDASLLELEITESTLLSDPVRSLENLRRISALGVQFSIDDFGTGYSSLSYLKQLPIQALKIDRSFVMDMVTDKQDEVIVSSTISLSC